MKNLFVAIVLLSTILMAGGRVCNVPSAVEPIHTITCNNKRVYIEEDVKLMWQDEHYTTLEIGAYKNEQSLKKAGNLRHAVNYCNSLVYGGFADWRLPTADELIHVHDGTNIPFVNIHAGDYWSATPTSDKKYLVVFGADAMSYHRSPKESNYIRCVRCVKFDYDKKGSRIVR